MAKQIVYKDVDKESLEKILRIGIIAKNFLSCPYLLLKNGNLVTPLLFPTSPPVDSFEELQSRKKGNRIDFDKENSVVYIRCEGYDTLSYKNLEKAEVLHYLGEFYDGRISAVHIITGGFLYGRDVLYSNSGTLKGRFDEDYIKSYCEFHDPKKPLPRERDLGAIDPEYLTKELFRKSQGSITDDLRHSYMLDTHPSLSDRNQKPNLDQQEGNTEENF